MDYKEKYEMALDRARKLYDKWIDEDGKDVAFMIFPELKESEDERIWIINYLNNRILNSTIIAEKENLKKAIAWLEKQGEQKDSFEMKTPEESLDIDSDTYNKIVDECVYGEQKQEWSEEDEVKINRIVACLENLNVADNDILLKDVDWLKSLKDKVQPKQEWSEEDENIRQWIISDIEKLLALQKKSYAIADKEINWLNSLKDRCTWKPSDEHYELEEFAKIVRSNLTGISRAVQELFEAKYLQLTGNKMYRGFKD